MKRLRKSFWCRRRAVFGLALLLACSDSDVEDSADIQVAPPPQVIDAAVPEATGSWARRYYEGYLAETVRGDRAAARAIYDEVVNRAARVDRDSAARAALRLAELELVDGNRRRAQELVARASVLGQGSLELIERADRAQARLASLRARGSDVRGPPAGTELEGVSAETRKQFAAAEGTLGDYHRRRLAPRLEGIQAAIRAKENAREQAERAYREVIPSGEREAVVAAEFRIGSLHHDLAMALMFDIPPELEKEEAAKLRRSLRGRAVTHLRKGRTAYERSLEVAQGRSVASTERWRLAAEVGLRAVKELLVGQE